MNTPNWFPDELTHAGSEHLDPGYVPTYDRKSATDPDEDLGPLRDLGLDNAHTLVDLGAGTGTFALAAAPVCRNVVAVDVSEEMLGVLRERREGLGIMNIETVRGGFLSYQHQGAPADFVYSRHALHHLPDFWKALALQRIAAILKPGGVLCLRDLVFSFDLNQAESAIESWLAGASNDPALGWTRQELEIHLREEYSTFSWLLEPMIERAGFDIHDVQHKGAIYSRYICVKRSPRIGYPLRDSSRPPRKGPRFAYDRF
jgi:ubiquinone/menaquinone biosynthesis C-methylase UbiE